MSKGRLAVARRELVLAVPVAPPDAIEKLHPEVDAIVCLDTPEDLGAIGFFLSRFPSDRRRRGDRDFRAFLIEQASERLPIAALGGPSCSYAKALNSRGA
jgi:predicted phosphoribosyltransferase